MKEILKKILLKSGLYYPFLYIRFPALKRQNKIQSAFYRQFTSEKSLVFDIGANMGQRTAVLKKTTASVIAIEPQIKCFEHLQIRFRRSKKVKLINAALDKTAGKGLLYEASSLTVSSMSEDFINTVGKSIFKEVSWGAQTTVKTLTLDMLVAEFGIPDFVKIDVEGYELNVLQGLSQAIPVISFEFIPSFMDNSIFCIEKLISLSASYKFNYTLGEELDFQLNENMEAKAFLAFAKENLYQAPNFGDIYAFYKQDKL